LVSTDNLADWGRREGVADAIRLGRGAVNSGLRESSNVVADAVEACLAAVFLERGLDAARIACAKIVGPSLEQLGAVGGRDPKSEIQEDLQAKGLGLPIYEVSNSGGPAHDRWFEVTLQVKGHALTVGRGRSKRLAERAAAEELLARREALLGPLLPKPVEPEEEIQTP
jgi:ribonuclease-3